MGRESEIKNSTIISIFEEKLPDELRRKWIERIYDKESTIDKRDKFPGFLKFLLERKMVIEYEINLTKRTRDDIKGNVKMTISKSEEADFSKNKCLLHPSGTHKTEDCRLFLDKNAKQRADIVKANRACFNCLVAGHTSRTCRTRKVCSRAECGKNHHLLLHDDNFLSNRNETNGFSAKCDVSNNQEKSLPQVMPIEVNSGSNKQEVIALWDSGSTVSLILNNVANNLKLKGKPVSITMETLGRVVKKQTNLFVMEIKDRKHNLVQIEAYGVDEISRNMYNTELQKKLFPEDFACQDSQKAHIGLLLGLNVVQYHPVPVKRKNNFVLFENTFGKCVGGSSCHSSGYTFTKVNFVQTAITMEEFYNVENLGIACNPKCGNCQCGSCPLGSSEFSIKEQKELEIIEKGLTICDKVWTAKYPWIKSSKQLPNNFHVAEKMLFTTERRLMKDPIHAKTYQSQIDDMIERGVAKKMSKEDLDYDGPVHYISHHEVLKQDSASTPCRIVFNASANYKSHVLNEYWAKGPDLLGNLLGILVKFREHFVGYIGDVKQMYHTVRLDPEDQQTHRFLWRDYRQDDKPDHYMMQVVSFGDRPAATIA